MITKNKEPKQRGTVRGSPGAAPALRVYVSKNGDNRPLRVDGKIAARFVRGYKFVEWSADLQDDLVKLSLTLSNTQSPYSFRLINRGWAQGYFSLQNLKDIVPVKVIRKLNQMEMRSCIEFNGQLTINLDKKID